MIYVLGAAFVISAVVSDWTSGFTILAFLVLNSGLSFFQEYRSEHIVAGLEKFIAPTANVQRAGEWKRLPREAIVPGDIIMLEPGDAFPADCRILRADGLMVDESALTGESVPAEKNERRLVKPPGSPADAVNIGFAGTIVIEGEAQAVVFATGAATVFGRIALESEAVKRPSIFEQNLASFSRFLVWLVVIVLGAVYAANLIIKGNTADPVGLLLFALAVAVSVIPEALPAVMTITFSKGALLLSKKKVVVKRLSAIEDLGHIQVLCTDKTGTITENKLAVGRIACGDANACLLSAMHSAERIADNKRGVSSFDAAVWKFASADLHRRAEGAAALFALPFDPVRRRNSAVVKRDGRTYLSIKGAPEAVLDICSATVSEREAALAEFRAMGEEGMRVLAVAEREVPVKEEYGPDDEKGARFMGLIGFIDPLKSSAREAIALAEKLHVRVKIITGDSFEVAVAVGLKTGIIASREGAINGPDLAALDEDSFALAVERCDVFARTAPDLKLRIVNALEKRYATGFLGEGVNDAPALKAANVAIVVKEASDIAREAADVVLLERSLGVVIDGIREGRAIFANVSKYIRYTLVGNLGNFFSIALISLFVDYLPLLPVQILLINLLTDIPFVAVATDLVDNEEVAAPHRFSIRGLALYCSILGFVASLFDFIFFAVFRGAPVGEIRTLWFVMNMLTEVATVFVLRTNRFFLAARRPSWSLAAISLVVIAVSIILPFTSLGEEVFKFVIPSGIGLAGIVVIMLVYVAATEAAKLAYLRFARKILPERP
jgi:P-type Mg2+ transporter